MEKKTLPYKNILVTGLFNPVSGGSQALFHTARQQKDLVSGKYLLQSDADYSRLLIHQNIHFN
jgi:hypothetical protein